MLEYDIEVFKVACQRLEDAAQRVLKGEQPLEPWMIQRLTHIKSEVASVREAFEK